MNVSDKCSYIIYYFAFYSIIKPYESNFLSFNVQYIWLFFNIRENKILIQFNKEIL